MNTFRIVAARVIALALSLGPVVAMPLEGQQLREQFRAVSPSVVVVRTVERTPASSPDDGFVSASGLGSGALVSADGTVAEGGYPWAPPLDGGFTVLELPSRE